MTFFKTSDVTNAIRQGDAYDEIASEAYRSVLVVSVDESIYDLPMDLNVTDLHIGYVPFINKTFYVDKVPTTPSISSTILAFAILGTVINETFTSNPEFDFQDGKTLADGFCDRGFLFENYTRAYLDHGGQRMIRMVLSTVDSNTSQTIVRPRQLQ